MCVVHWESFIDWWWPKEDSFNPCSCLFLRRWHKSVPTNPVFFSCFLAKSPPLIPKLSIHTYTLTCQKGHVPKVFLPSQLVDTVWLLNLGNYRSRRRRLLDFVSCWVIYSVAVHFICPPTRPLPLLWFPTNSHANLLLLLINVESVFIQFGLIL